MTNVAIAGFGLMGRTHLRAYLGDARAKIAGLFDPDAERLKPEAITGNLKGLGEVEFDPANVRHYATLDNLLDDDAVEAVSICSPTPAHVKMTIAALRAGKHVLVEKPLGLTYAEAMRAVDVASQASTLIAMPAMCMRFWPAWQWLRDAIGSNRYGRVLTATFTRLGSLPTWAPFYRDVKQSGGAILDLHIHDVDFIRFCFGEPHRVRAWGSSDATAGVDHVLAVYEFDEGPAIVAAEGGWSMKNGFPFTMRYLVNFEKATASFGFNADPQLVVNTADGHDKNISLPDEDGYVREVRHFLDCIESGTHSTIVTLNDGAEAVRLVESERKSIHTGEPVPLTQSSTQLK